MSHTSLLRCYIRNAHRPDSCEVPGILGSFQDRNSTCNPPHLSGRHVIQVFARPITPNTQIMRGDRLCLVGHPVDNSVLDKHRHERALEPNAAQPEAWSFLLPPTMNRSYMVVADADGANPTTVFSGMRVGFPRWVSAVVDPADIALQPKNNHERIAFWATFEPSHRDFLSSLMHSFGLAHRSSFSLRSRDPAVLLDMVTGELEWMPINAIETEQVGHYYQIHGKHAEAWRWYERAAELRAKEQVPEPKEQDSENDRRDQTIADRDAALFRFICLRQLGRDADADQQHKLLEQFTAELMSLESKDKASNDRDFSTGLLRDLHLASVFVSVNATDLADIYFKKLIQIRRDRKDDLGRSTAMLSHLQIVLVDQRFDDFVRLALNDYSEFIPKLTVDWQTKMKGANANSLRPMAACLLTYP